MAKATALFLAICSLYTLVRAVPNLRISARQSTFRLPVAGIEEGADVWNAAAILHPTLGWVSTATHTRCFWAYCGIFGQTPRPWVAFLGRGQVPDLQRFGQPYGSVWEFEQSSLVEPFRACGGSNESEYAPLDFRCAVIHQAALAHASTCNVERVHCCKHLRQTFRLNLSRHSRLASPD